MNQLKRLFPCTEWLREYNGASFADDMLAAVVVMIMLVPQSLAYAMLAGLPPEVGLYASIVPLMVYAVFGTSRTLSVGPVAIISLMTAAALGRLDLPDIESYVAAALTLALLSGLMLLALGLLRLGFLANFLSHPVIAGFITASAVIIALSQMQHILGISASGQNLPELLPALYRAAMDSSGGLSLATLVIGLGSLFYLLWARRWLAPLLQKLGLSARMAAILSRISPVVAVAVTILAAWSLDLGQAGVALTGQVPAGLPGLTLPDFSPDIWWSLLGSAALIAIIGFVESVSVAQGLAARRRQRIDPNQELVALGNANIAASFTGGFPVTGGFARSVVNFDAGAATPAAGFFAAVLIAIATFFLMPVLAFLPKATLAATIIVAVLALVDLTIVKKAWQFSAADFMAVMTTIVVTLLAGVEAGVASGILVSILVHLYKSSRPHVAVVGQVPGTQHFRNVNRHKVITQDSILSLRIDESLYFANTRYLEDLIYREVAERPALKHVVLMCSAVNEIDLSALESLETINRRLDDNGITLNLSEIKGPVMDCIERTHFLEELTGQVYLSQHQAVSDLTGRE
jgi:SulP family sulfate permease